MSKFDRRSALRWLPATLFAPMAALAGARIEPRAEAPLVGIDPIFDMGGLRAGWTRAMRQDLGWAAQWTDMDTGAILDALEKGSIPTGVYLGHPKADALDKQGLIFDRHVIGQTEVMLLGPNEDMAGIRGEKDAARALSQVVAAAKAGAAAWQAPLAGSALAGLADTLTQGAASKTPSTQGKSPAYRLITRAEWLARGARGERLKVWPLDDPRMVLRAEVACSYRGRQSGGRLLVAWLQWPLAQKSFAPKAGWRGAKG